LLQFVGFFFVFFVFGAQFGGALFYCGVFFGGEVVGCCGGFGVYGFVFFVWSRLVWWLC